MSEGKDPQGGDGPQPTTSSSPGGSKPTAISALTRFAGVGGGLIGAFFAVVSLSTPILKLVGLLTCVCVAVLMLQAAHDRDHGKLTTGMLLWLSAAGTSTLILVVLMAGQIKGPTTLGTAQAGPGGQPATTASTSMSSTLHPTDATKSSPPTETSSTSSVPASEQVWLADLQAIYGNNEDAWTTSSVQVKGVTYNKALTADDGEWCEFIQIDYVLGGQYSRFTSMVGLADDSPKTSPLTFHVLADDKPVKKVSGVGVGAPQPVEISVQGVSRLALIIEQEEGLCGHVGVWMDPSLTK